MYRLWGRPRLVLCGQWGLFPMLKRPWRKAGYSFSSGAGFKNGVVPPVSHMSCMHRAQLIFSLVIATNVSMTNYEVFQFIRCPWIIAFRRRESGVKGGNCLKVCRPRCVRSIIQSCSVCACVRARARVCVRTHIQS